MAVGKQALADLLRVRMRHLAAEKVSGEARHGVIVLPFLRAGERHCVAYCWPMAAADRTPPYRIVTERLVLRCYDPTDAPLVKDAVDSSIEHLRPWMPWAQAPASLDDTVALLRGFRAKFDLDQDWIYGIFTPDGSQVVGGAGLHPRVSEGGLEIGYWIRAGHTGAGLATEAAAALTRVAVELHGADRVEIHVDPANTASLAVPRKLGFREEATLRRRLPPVDPSGPPTDEVVFSLLADELPSSPAGDAAFTAFDAAGRPLASTG
jgi:RimJ/RimL family protein N-acetyltransferase